MDRSGTPTLALLIAVPVMSKERFAELAGVEVGVVRGMLDRGHLPGIKVGRHRLVNVAALQARALREDAGTGFEVREYGKAQGSRAEASAYGTEQPRRGREKRKRCDE